MGKPIDYARARLELAQAFELAQEDFRNSSPPEVSIRASTATKALFKSKTQAFREVLIGCCLARLLDRSIDIRSPYMKQSDDSYNGRSLDENVVNPFLKANEVPCSAGPFLSVFRRNIKFELATERGVKDKEAFRAMLTFIDELNKSDEREVQKLFSFLLHEFVAFRSRATIALNRVNRLSLAQSKTLINNLLDTKSGGLLPVLVSVAALQAMSEAYELPWNIEFQNINVADAAKGAGGDITVQRNDEIVISIEVTERKIDIDRIRSTFAAKISPNQIENYLFLHSTAEPTSEAKVLAKTYFAVGHEINFLPTIDWVLIILTALGNKGREYFIQNLLNLLDQSHIPATLKVAWNRHLQAII